MALLNAALAYAERGWSVVPLHYVKESGECSCKKAKECVDAGKHPIYAGWVESRTASAKMIQTLWEEDTQRNVGIRTGEFSGIWVLDVDPKNGGDVALDNLIKEHGEWPET